MFTILLKAKVILLVFWRSKDFKTIAMGHKISLELQVLEINQNKS